LPEPQSTSHRPWGGGRNLALLGVDVGGTKTHIAVITRQGERVDRVVPSERWRHGALFGDPANLDRLADLVASVSGLDERTQAVFGVHGCDSPSQVAAVELSLGARLGSTVTVANDAELLGWAAGVTSSIQMIVGTGAIVTGRTADGSVVSAAGHGWLLSDDGSAPALIRETVREILHRHDEGTLRDEALVDELLERFDASDLPTLALAATHEAGLSGWAPHAPLVFEHADRGSAVAQAVVETAGERLAAGAVAVSRRGAVGSVVVAAGGVIVNQPRLQDAVRAGLHRFGSPLELHILSVPPVDGALAWAATLAASEPAASA
jgi:N-acetylglucosamine kinase-like BadF-type ATPase